MPAVVETLPVEVEILNSWNLDVLTFEAADVNSFMLHIFFDSEIGRNTGGAYTTVKTFQCFMDFSRDGYNNVPYHGWSHATDVAHACYRMLVELECKKWLTAIEQYALLLASICHDVGHMGTTNAFLVETGHDL